MTFDEALELVESQNIVHVIIEDFSKNRVMTLSEPTPPQLIEKLKANKKMLMHLNKVTFNAATEAIKNANMKNAAKWQVSINGLQENNLGMTVHTGYVSPKENELQIQLLTLKKDIEIDKRIDELEKKYEGKKESGFGDMVKFLPLLGLVLEIKPDKLQAINALSGLVNSMNGGQQTTTAISGIGKLNEGAELQMTESEEKIFDEIGEGVKELATKVPMEKINEFINTLNEKPQFLETLITLAQNHK